MVPNSEESNGATSNAEQATSKSVKVKGKSTPSKSSLNLEKDTEEYRKLRDRNNEAVKKSRTRTKLRTQNTLDKVEKLRNDNSKLEDRIEGLKKELELLKELFVSHAGTNDLLVFYRFCSYSEFFNIISGTKSMKRLTEVDLDVLLAEAAPNNKKNKKGSTNYSGRSREVIEKEVLALLGQPIESEDDQIDEEDDDDEPQPSTSRDIDQGEMSEQSMMEDSMNAIGGEAAPDNVVENLSGSDNAIEMTHNILTVEPSDDGEITETYTIVDDGTGGPTIWTTENGEAVVVTIEQDEQGTLVASGVQQNLHDIIQGEILMLE